jgi:large subunit ribosomal protein L10
MPRAEKEARVREIAEELKGSEAAVLTGYRGLTVQESGELRGALAEVETRLSVVKNSLAMLAVKDAGLEGLTEMFDGPTAVAYVKGDAVAAAKRIVEQAKRYPVLEIRGGFAEGRILTSDDIRTLAALEPREVMLAKIAGLGKAQISRAAFMFQALQSRFVLLLQALREKLPEEGPEAEEAPDASQEEARVEDEQPDAERPADAPEEETTPDEGGDEAAQAADAEEATEGES